ncbi:MAG: MarR family transcriptional regulator [Bacteroidales bacterium]|nr:MarR family transcriptional regulator [Bacteroidales bacterium]
MDTTTKVLDVFKASSEPLNAGKVAELSGIDKKEVEKAMKVLQKSGAITSPKRCFWTATK